jgi:hypothetical protein
MQFSEIGILAACSHTKSRPVHEKLRARTLHFRTPERRLKDWIERISKVTGELPAFNLYCGVYWAGVASLWRKAASRQGNAPLWILSAGYGLIPSDAVIAPYAATLSPKDQDSVVTGLGRTQVRVWWEKLGEWAGPQIGAPRSLAALASAYPRTLWIVVGGPHYVHVLAEQLEAVHQMDGGPGRFVLISPGSTSQTVPPAVEAALVRADARWENRLGRGKTSIGVRIATHLFERADGNAASIPDVRGQIQRETESLASLDIPSHARKSDDDVRRYIRDTLREQPGSSFSNALRAFRDFGFACEYRRFRGLYEEVTRLLHAKT